jgi:hypothetical protein
MDDSDAREYVAGDFIEHQVWICMRCNRSMAAQIEDPAIPLLAPLLRGVSIVRPIARPSQEAIARWIAKIALLMPLVARRPGQLRRLDWDYLRENGRPTPTTNIWVGAIKMDFDTVERHDDLVFANRRGNVEHGFVQTIALGSFVAKTLIYPRSDAKYESAAQIAFEPEFNGYLIPVWPPQVGDFVYPPVRIFDLPALTRLGRKGERPTPPAP